MMKLSNEELVIVKLLKQAVEAEGCELAQVDFENKTLNVEGPDEVVPDCARAVAEIMAETRRYSPNEAHSLGLFL